MMQLHTRSDVSLRRSIHEVLFSDLLSAYYAVPFLIGLLFGSFIAMSSAAPFALFSSLDFLSADAADSSFFMHLFHSLRFILIACLLASSILGVFLLPLLVSFRAFIFACSVTALVHPPAASACLAAFLSLGIPMLFELPAFSLAVSDAFFFSKGLLFPMHRVPFSDRQPLRHLLLIVLLCLAASAYSSLLLPSLLRAVSAVPVIS